MRSAMLDVIFRPESTLQKNKLFYGWVLVFVSILVQAFSFGLGSYAFSVFAASYEKEFDVGRGLLMLCMTGFLLSVGFMSPKIGSLMDSLSIRRIMLIGSVLMATGYILLSYATNMWLVILLYTVLIACGGVTLGPLCTSTLLTRWFESKRGLAFGIATLGTQFGGLFFPPLTAWMIDILEWRLTLRYIGMFAIVFLPLLIFLSVVNHPADRGLMPDGEDGVRAPEGLATNENKSEEIFSSQKILQSRNFWLVVIVVSTSIAVSTIVLSNLALLGMGRGMDIGAASLLISLSALMGFISSPLFGRLADMFDVRWGLVGMLVMNIAGLLAYIASDSNLSLIVLTVLVGLAAGGCVPLWGVLVSRLFSIVNFGRIMGLMSPFVYLVIAFSPAFAGAMYDATSSYRVLFILVAIVLLLVMMTLPFIAKKTQVHSASAMR